MTIIAKFVTLKFNMETSTTVVEIAKALSEFQGQVEPVTKDAINPFFKSKYASMENIVATIKKPLVKNGLSFVQLPTGDNGLTTMILHVSGEWIRSTAIMHPTKNDPQGQGSAITYLRRYALSALLGLVTDEDDDGNKASTPTVAPKSIPKPIVAPKVEKDMYKEALKAITEATSKERLEEIAINIGANKTLTAEQKEELIEGIDYRISLID